jgi:hypothetical protein
MRYIAILILLSFPATSVYADNTSLCFSLGDAVRLLRIVEKDFPDCQRELTARRALDNGAVESIQECREMGVVLTSRVNELTLERNKCVSLADNTAKAGEAAVKAARGTWWDRVVSAGKWVALGSILTLAVTFGR